MVDDDRQIGASPLAFLAGGGEMGDRIRCYDWSKTPLGRVLVAGAAHRRAHDAGEPFADAIMAGTTVHLDLQRSLSPGAGQQTSVGSRPARQRVLPGVTRGSFRPDVILLDIGWRN